MSLSEKFGIPASLLDAVKTTLAESDAYQQKVKAHMAKKGVKSLNDMTPEQKKKFFNELDAMHTAKNEEVELDESAVIGKPEIKGPSQHKQRGTPGDTHTSVTTHHKVGDHHYKVTTEIDHDGDKFHTVHKTDSAGRNRSVVHKSNTPATEYHGWGRHENTERTTTHSTPEHKANVSKILKHHDAAVKKHEDSVNEEFESVEEAQSHAAKTTMKHIKNPTKGEKEASKLIKPGIAGYGDRIAMLHSAKNRDALKKEDLDFLEDLTDEEIEEFMQTEEYEQLDELSKDTLKSYKKKATDNLQSNVHRKHGLETVRTLMGRLAEPDKNKKPSKGGYKTITQVAREQDNANVSDGLKRHMPHMADKVNQMHKELQADRVKTTRNINNRKAGLDSAEKRLKSRKYGKNEDFDILSDFSLEDIESFMQTEDYNQLDELSKNTLASYIKKRSNDVATQGALTRKHAMDAEAQKKEHGGYTTKAVRDLDDKANKAFMKGWKHRQNIGKAVDKLTKEELEFIEALNAGVEGVAEGSKHASRPGTQARPGSATQAQAGVDRKRAHRAELDAKLAQQAAKKNKTAEE